MKIQHALSLVATLASVAALPPHSARAALSPYFFTIGDSTVTDDAGWGAGFLAYLNDGADGENRAKSGTTTASWKSNGRWNDLLESIADITSNGTFTPIVTMQWGHNDQKEGGLTLDEYRANLVAYAKDLKAVGAVPIIITPITRRTFVDGKVRQDFVEWRGKAIAAAKDGGAKWLDLTLASTNYVNSIGEENAQYYNYGSAGTDKTHLNSAGSKVFGRMVADLLLAKRPDLEVFFKKQPRLSSLIAAGEFATGDE
ncbi:hypothetical protein N0V90_012612 [Kalmusia sp. IMI 367209]|nr:hypothetical protein N0V90_012612 [Kalmusia sp. IMI 367209]